MAYRTVEETKQYVAQMLSEDETSKILAGDTTEGTHNLLDRWLTKTWERICSHAPWVWLQESINLTWPGASGGSPSILYLPHFIYRIQTIIDPNQTATEWPIKVVNAWEFDHSPVLKYGGSQSYLVVHGYYGVEADVGTAGAVTATSSVGDSSDDGLQVRIEGLDASNYDLIETITLSSDTATTSGSFKAGAGGVRRVSLVPSATARTGKITITDAGGTTIERLDSAREREHQHMRTELYAQTSGAATLKVRYQRRPFNVTAASDIIPIPFEFVDLMELGMMMELFRFRADWTGFTASKGEFMERMKEFRAWSHRDVASVKTVEYRGMWGRRWPY